MLCPHCNKETAPRGELMFTSFSVLWEGKQLNLFPEARRILRQLWDEDFIERQGKPLQWHITRIRKEFERLNIPLRIRSVRNQGYVLQPILPANSGLNQRPTIDLAAST